MTLANRLWDLAGPGTILINPRASELVGPEVGLAQPTRRRLEVTTGDVLVRSVTGCSKTHPYGGGAFSGGVINEYRRAA